MARSVDIDTVIRESSIYQHADIILSGGRSLADGFLDRRVLTPAEAKIFRDPVISRECGANPW